MSPIQTSAPSQAPDMSGALFGHTADGMLVARVGDHAYAMMPGRDGKHYLTSGWRIARPMVEWTRSDFYAHGGDLDDETAFRSKVLEQAQHFEERRLLGRRDVPGGAHPPWGPSQGGTVYAEGVTSHATAGHGGFKLSADRNRKVRPMLRAAGGWYEEDECWAIVAFTFPHLFTALERRSAERTIKDSWPEAWEAISGTILAPGESRRKDQRDFEIAHTNDWIVVSAITSLSRPGRRIPRRPVRLRHRPGPACRLCRPVQLRRLVGKGVTMTLSPDVSRQLSRMEEACRQTQRQLDMVDRQITRRMTALIPDLLPRRTRYRDGKAPDPQAFLERYRSQLAALTAERQPEIDALSRKLARQEQVIARFLEQHGEAVELSGQVQ